MNLIGPLAFANPWVLLLLLGLPVIWLLLRNLPPAPQRLSFPAIRLLFKIKQDDQTPHRTPWWLLLLRTLIAAIIIIALADPRWNESSPTESGSATIIVVDNGWTVAHAWQERLDQIRDLIGASAREQKEALVIPTAGTGSSDLTLRPARLVRESVVNLKPHPWQPKRAELIPALNNVANNLKSEGEKATVYWLTDGLQQTGDAEFFKALENMGDLVVVAPPKRNTALGVKPVRPGQALEIEVVRGHGVGQQTGTVRVLGDKGKLLAREPFSIQSGKKSATVSVKLPYEVNAEVQRIEIHDVPSAGAVTLTDDRWRRKRVGVATATVQDDVQPLLSDIYYIERALAPFADIEKASISELLEKDNISVLIVSDVGKFSSDVSAALANWVEAGGTLVRFAGPRLATQNDDLIPVQLRQGNRTLDGSLSWSKPQHLSSFPSHSPFADLHIADDVTVSRQVLAEPSLELPVKTWAQLTDGTPLVTGTSSGDGTVVLFHVTANPDWSSLPMSGLFVDMLDRLIASAQVAGEPGAAVNPEIAPDQVNKVKPLLLLDAFGVLSTPNVTASAVAANQLSTSCPSPTCPPGYYGEVNARTAVNTIGHDFTLEAFDGYPSGATIRGYAAAAAQVLAPLLLATALCLLMADLMIALAFAGLFTRTPAMSSTSGALALVFALTLLSAPDAHAQQNEPADAFAKRATLETALAYVQSGDSQVDKMSHAGLLGISRVLKDRTAVELGEPIGVDIHEHELAFFPLIYWPVISEQTSLGADVIEKVDHYLKNGGTILFDTQDHQTNLQLLSRGRSGNTKLKSLLGNFDMPPLEPVSEDHVLTKAFYLLQDFPGRWSGGRLWVEATTGQASTSAGSVNDGVSAIIVGSNDYAAAWAEDELGRPLAAVVPGGDRQREWARRFGVNLVIYALTGNYKADQVHVPALLERLGQ